MCNCGHDTADVDEAKKLQQKAAAAAMFAAALAFFPTIFSAPDHRHHAITWVVFALQLCLIARFVFLIRKRKQLLACSQ